MIKEQLTTDAALRTNNWGFFALRKIPVNCTQSRGAVLLIAILVASVALAVGLGVYNRTYKELLFASFWKQTQVGFSAADAGLECAMYWDTHPAAAESCFGQPINWTSASSGGVATSTFSAQVANGCVNVTVVKSGSAGPYPLTFVATTTAQPQTPDPSAGPLGIAISPDGTSVYVVNNGAEIYQYKRATTTPAGALSLMSPPSVYPPGAGSTVGVVVSPDGKSVYVTDVSSDSIFKYDRDSTTGALSNLVTTSLAGGAQPYGIVVSPDITGASVYVANYGDNTILQFNRDSAGALAPMIPASVFTESSSGIRGIAISSDGNSVYVAGTSKIYQYKRNADGTLASLTPATMTAGNTSYYGSIVVSSDRTSVYRTSLLTGVLQYKRNADGTLTELSPRDYLPGSNGPTGIVISSDGSSVYVANNVDNTIAQHARINGLLSTMQFPAPQTLDANLSGFAIPNTAVHRGIAISPDNKSVYMTNFDEGLIYQFSTGAGDSPVSTLINARGYNTPYNTSSFDCANTSPRRVERGLRVEY